MKISFIGRSALGLAVGAGAVLSACYSDITVETNDQPPSIGTSSLDLFISQASNLWSSANPIPVCFQPAQDVWDNQRANYDAKKAQIRGWVESTYETIPKVAIDFTGWGECPNYASFATQDEGSDRIEIGIDGGGGATSTGRNWISAGLGTAATWLNHEVLHTLGFFDHEHQRTDSTGSVGTWDEYTGTPITCVNEIVYHLNADGSLGNTACNPAYTRQNTAGIYLTVYDFWSILNGTNYCHCRDGLSVLDKLGLEMAYPTTASLNNLPVQVEYGFRGGAQSVIGFSNVILHNDWFSRGALNGAFNNVGATWRPIPFSGSGVLDSGAGFAVGSSGTYRADWTDFAGRGRTSESLVVDVSPSRATALVMAVL